MHFESSEKGGKKDNREMCKYGSECYQKNPFHLAKFRHPKRQSDQPLGNNSKKNRHESPEPSSTPADTVQDDLSLESKKEEVPSKLHTVSESSDEDDIESKEKGTSRFEDSSKVSTGDTGSEDFIFTNELDGDDRDKLKRLYVVQFPDDFFTFYDYCKSVYSKAPKTSLRDVGLELVGPFDLLCGGMKRCTSTDIIRHCRYFYDPPEFFTVLKSTDSEFHYGYFFDEPDQPPVFVGSNDPSKGCIIKVVAPNLFGAVNAHINNYLKKCDPFKKIKIQKLQTSLNKWAKDSKFTVEPMSPELKKRNARVNTRTFHEAGIVVPYDKTTDVGYRPLAENNKTLKELLTKIVECDTETEREARWNKVEHVVTFASIAADECDFGTPLELGIDMFCMGHECFHRTACRLMTTGYNLLSRDHFSTIIDVHLKNRLKKSNLNFAAK